MFDIGEISKYRNILTASIVQTLKPEPYCCVVLKCGLLTLDLGELVFALFLVDSFMHPKICTVKPERGV